MSFIDRISPQFVGSDRLKVSLSADTLYPQAGQAAVFLIDYSGADADGGVCLPLRLIIQAPTVAGFFKHIYRRFLPIEVVYFPISGGKHLITLGEIGHNQFFGALAFDVAGDTINTPSLSRG